MREDDIDTFLAARWSSRGWLDPAGVVDLRVGWCASEKGVSTWRPYSKSRS